MATVISRIDRLATRQQTRESGTEFRLVEGGGVWRASDVVKRGRRVRVLSAMSAALELIFGGCYIEEGDVKDWQMIITGDCKTAIMLNCTYTVSILQPYPQFEQTAICVISYVVDRSIVCFM